MTVNQPHAKYPHVFVVIRIDSVEGIDADLDPDRLVVTSVFESEEAASADAERLNLLAEERGTGSRYITRVGRLKSD
jgi:hypothetical protein